MEFKYKIGDFVEVQLIIGDGREYLLTGIILGKTIDGYDKENMYAIGMLNGNFDGHSCDGMFDIYMETDVKVPNYFKNKCWWCCEDDILGYASNNKVVF